MRDAGTAAGVVVQIDDTSGGWVPVPPEMDNTTAELLAVGLGRWIAGCLGDLGAQAREVVYDAQAAESLVVGCQYRQRAPLWKEIQLSVTPSEAVHWWVRGHVEAPREDEDYECPPQGNAWTDGYAEVAALKSTRGHRVALPSSLRAVYASRRADGPGKMEWHIHRPGYWRPPR